MQNNFRIKFNPATKEIEVEGNEKFVKTYFKKLQSMMSGYPDKTGAIKEKAAKKAGKKKVTNIDKVVSLIQGSKEGISTAELKKKSNWRKDRSGALSTMHPRKKKSRR